jgi:aspartate aminotransferase
MIYSKKAERIAPSLTLSITAKAKQMKAQGLDVIGFGAGEPDFNTPKNIEEAAIKAIRQGLTRYTAASGIDELKQAIVNKLKNDNHVDYMKSQVIISTGAKQCLANIFEAILNPGDEVIVPMPYWVSYPELIKMSYGVPVFPETKEIDNFKYTVSELRKVTTSNTKSIILNSPNNPTGTVYSREELISIADFAKEQDLIIISDEIYEKLIYGDKTHISIASLSEDAYNRTIIVNGVSKSFAMTGWRIGYAAGNEVIIKLMSNIQSHTTSNPNSIAQYASVEALEGDQSSLKMMVGEFSKRRDYMVDKINTIKSLSCIKPDGAFYVMVNISGVLNKKINDVLMRNSLDFSKFLLEDQKVAVIPGVAFGLDDYVRISYATSMENIKEGLSRIEKFINKVID